MRRVLLSLFCVTLCTPHLADAQSPPSAHADPDLGVVFPETLGGLKFDGLSRYPQPEMGCSIRYRGPDSMVVDIYVYDAGRSDIPDGHDNKLVKAEMDSITRVLPVLVQRGEYRDVTPPTSDVVPEQGPIQFRRLAFELNRTSGSLAGDRLVAERMATGFGGKFVKIGVTYKKESRRASQRYGTALIDELVELLSQTTEVDGVNREHELVLQAISRLEADPDGRNATIDAVQIIHFAEKSEDVQVLVKASVLPWLMREPNIRRGEVLIAGFVGGNVRPQLKKQVVKDHPVDGLLLMCRVYTALRKNDSVERIEELEEWSKMDRDELTKLTEKSRRSR